MIFMKDIAKLIISFLTHRLFVLTVMLVLMFSILIARLFNLQIINGSRLEKEFELSVLRDIDIEGQRGLIYDRNGTPLAVNEVAYSVTYDNSVYTQDRNISFLTLIRILNKNGDSLSLDFPIYLDEDKNYAFIDSLTKVKRLKNDVFGEDITEEELDYTADQVMDYLIDKFFEIDRQFIEDNNMTEDELLNLIILRYAHWAKGYYKFIPEEIAINISDESLAEINENKNLLPGVSVVEDPIRRYLYPEYTAHILGYTGTISDSALEKFKPYGYDQNDTVGRIGIEEAMELYLHAQDGSQTVEVDMHGRTEEIESEIEPIAGKDIYLTIDLDLQRATQDLLVKQLNYIISTKLVLHKPTRGEMRVPELKDVYSSLFENNTIDIGQILQAKEGTYSYNILEDYNIFYTNKTLEIMDSLTISNVLKNEELDRYYTYLLDTLESDRLLLSDYKTSSGFVDYENDNISFMGLLNYFIKEDIIDLSRLFDDESINRNMTNSQRYDYLIHNVIEQTYFNRYQFERNIFLEMSDEEVFAFVDLSMLLIEQNIVTATDEEIQKLKNGRLKPLDFMKQLILDIQLTPQQIALDPSTGGAVVVDVDTGDVLALVSYPSYDNNRISEYQYYKELLNDPTKPLYPTATQGKTAPGSTFKMLSAVAGLEEGVIDKNDRITCTGKFTKVSPAVACWISAYGGSHGSINVVTGIAVSCNSFFNEVGYRLGITEEGTYNPKQGVETLTKYATMFGLNTTTGIELIESKPSTPGSIEDGIVNPVTAAMGQEYNSYTPTQMARYIATLANGGTLYELTLIDRIYNSDGTLYEDRKPTVTQVNHFKEGTIETVHEGMIEVTTGSRGTARTFYRDFPVLVGGKTGTAQENKLRASHAVFASFAPADDPEIAIVVAIPYSYTAPFSSGFIVGTVAKDIYSAYYDLNNEKKGYEYVEDSTIN